MKKNIFFFVLAIASIGYLLILWDPFTVDEPIDDNESKVNGDEEVTLTFWRNYGNKAENKAYKELITDFNNTHPDINIKMEEIEYSNYEVKLRTEILTGIGPDIVAIDSPNVALYANANLLLSLDSFIENDVAIHEDFPKPVIQGLTYKDEIYLMPIVESSIALYYNIHIFEKYDIPFPSKSPVKPMTWEEVIDISKKIHDPANDVYAIDPAQGFPKGESAAYFKLPILWQFGADVLSPDGTTASGYLDSTEALEALQFYQDMYHKDKIASIELPEKAFESNKLAMTILGSWSYKHLENNGLKLGEDFGIAPLPKGTEQVVPNGSWSLGISSKTEYPKKAWEFIRYATSYERAKKYAEITGDIPARYSVVEDLPQFNEYPLNILSHQAHYYSRNRPITPIYPEISKIIQQLFEDIGILNKDVQQSAEEAVKKINASLRELGHS